MALIERSGPERSDAITEVAPSARLELRSERATSQCNAVHAQAGRDIERAIDQRLRQSSIVRPIACLTQQSPFEVNHGDEHRRGHVLGDA